MKDLSFLKIWDMYSELLTPHQREITDLYFNYDLSLGEIAEQKGVSRQSISDCINKCKKELEQLEKKLGFVSLLEQKENEQLKTIQQVTDWANNFQQKHSAYQKEIDQLKNTIVKKIPQE